MTVKIEKKISWTASELLDTPLDVVDTRTVMFTIPKKGLSLALIRSEPGDGDHMLTRAEARECLDWIERFYAAVSDEAIDYYNTGRIQNGAESTEGSRWIQGVQNNVPAREKNPGFVYLIQCGQWFKIGASTDPESRLKKLGTLPPFDLELLHIVYSWNMYALEGRLHERFADKRKSGEWFELSPEDVEYIKEL